MADVVQLMCPHCRNNLRIPTAWAGQPMRCNFCRQVFLAQRKASAGAAASGVKPAPGANGQTDPFRTLPTPPAARPPGVGGLPFKPLPVAGLIIVGVGLAAFVVGIVVGPALRKMFKPETPTPTATATDKKGNDPIGAPGKNPPPETAKERPASEPATRDPQPDQGPPDNAKGQPDKDKKPADSAKVPADKDKKLPDSAKGPPEKDKGPTVAPAVRFILNELTLLPPATGGKAAPIDPASLPEFPAKVLDTYKADYKSIMDFKDREADFPLRAAVAKTVLALRNNVNNTTMRPTIPGNLVDKQLFVLKNQVKAEQDIVAKRELPLKDLVKELVEVGEKHRAGETKRWQVLFDYALLRLKARVVHVVEYNFSLALVRTDSLAPLKEDEKIYRLTPQEKVSVNEAYVKQYVKDLKNGWTALAKNHPETPWAVLAPREQAVLLGLSWQPAKQ